MKILKKPEIDRLASQFNITTTEVVQLQQIYNFDKLNGTNNLLRKYLDTFDAVKTLEARNSARLKEYWYNKKSFMKVYFMIGESERELRDLFKEDIEKERKEWKEKMKRGDGIEIDFSGDINKLLIK